MPTISTKNIIYVTSKAVRTAIDIILTPTFPHLLRGEERSLVAAVPKIHFDMQQVKSDATGTVTIGVPVVVGGVIILLAIYWFFFLRDSDEDMEEEEIESVAADDAITDGITVVVDAQRETDSNSTIRKDPGQMKPKGPAIWLEHMKYRESKSFSIPQTNPDSNFEVGAQEGAMSAVPAYVKQNSNFLPSLATWSNNEKPLTKGDKNKSPYRSSYNSHISSRSQNSPEVAPHTTPNSSPVPRDTSFTFTPGSASGQGQLRDGTKTWDLRKGTLSFTQAVASTDNGSFSRSGMASGKNGYHTHASDGHQSFKSKTAVAVTSGNFFDPVVLQGEIKTQPRHKNSTSTHTILVENMASNKFPKSSHSPSNISPQSEPRTISPMGGSGPGGLNRSPQHAAEKTRPAIVEYFLGESKLDRVRAQDDATRLEVRNKLI